MALGMTFGGSGDGGDILAFCKYDARSGRMFRPDRKQGADGAYVTDTVDITSTFRAIFDMENIEIGYLLFAAGVAPQALLSPLGAPMPQKPAGEGWKQGARVMVKLHASCGGDVREISGNSASFLRGFDQLHTAYEAGKDANSGKLPVVVLKTTQSVTSGSGVRKSVNYEPVFEIVGWAARPVDLVHVSKVNGAAPATSAPSTGSTQVGAPAAKQLEPAGADGGFG
jgi:hypothetical protein